MQLHDFPNGRPISTENPLPIVQSSGAAGPTTTGSYKKITGLSAVKGLDDGGAIPTDARYALVFVTGQGVRWRMDGNAPTASLGIPIAAGASMRFNGAEMAAVKFIEQAASATLDIHFSK